MTDTRAASAPGPRRPEPGFLKLVDLLSKGLALIAAFALVLLAINVLVDVTGRAAMNRPYPGTLEYTQNWWMPTLTLMAFAFTEWKQEHIKVTILLDTLPLMMRRMVEGIFGLIATALLLALTYHGFNEAMDAAAIGKTTSSSPPVAVWPFMFMAPVGVFALALQTAATSYRYFAGFLPIAALHAEGEAV
ncbi:MAG: TRAP transporter small permease [Pseudomonadota bacterium]|nr:TRAP transporter small permease [Pseudomonadota bacterium]